MKLDRIILDHFLTYDHVDYKIGSTPQLVQGRNLTEEDQESNGSGKSGIFTGIEFGITASNSRDVRDSELIMYGYPKARVQLFASCNVRGESIHIDWIIQLKGSNKLVLKKKKLDTEWEEVSFSNVNDGKKYILSWFAISKEDLFNYYIINKSRFKSFFKTSNREKVDLINRFSDASIIDGIEDIKDNGLKAELENTVNSMSKLDGRIELTESNILKQEQRDFITEFNDSVEEVNTDIENLEDSILEYKEDIQNSEHQKIEISKTIKDIEKKKTPYHLDIENNEKLLKSLNEDLQDAKKVVNGFTCTDWELEREAKNDVIRDNNDKLFYVEQEQEKENEQETKILSLLRSIEVTLQNSIECPKCNHEFVLDGDIDSLKARQKKGKQLKSQLEDKKKRTLNTHKSIKASIKEIEALISVINSKESKENQKKNALVEAVNSIKHKYNDRQDSIHKIKHELKQLDTYILNKQHKIKDIDLSIKECRNNIKRFEDEINSHKQSLAKLKIGNNKEILTDYKTELEKYKSEKIVFDSKVQDIEEQINRRDQWVNIFKQFRMFLANQSLEVIQYHCNRYLKEMDSDIRVKLEGFKMLANGSIKDEITAKVVRDTERSFSSFSGGEQGRLLFAAILANRYMINNTHKYGGLDFLSVDEVFEGVDSIGLKSLIKAAKQLDIAVMIITHVTDEEVGEDTLLIEKVNGVSKIKI